MIKLPWKYGWNEGGGSTYFTYVKGYPFEGPTEPNVVAQWVFDEASGNIVDEVSGITLVPNEVQNYGQTISGNSMDHISPGIQGTTSTSFTPYFSKPSANASLDWTTNNGLTLEAWYNCTTYLVGEFVPFFNMSNTFEGASLMSFYIYNGLVDNPVNARVVAYLRTDDNVGLYNEFTPVTTLFTTLPQKLRLVVNTSGNMELFQNGVSCGTISAATIAGKTLSSLSAEVGRLRWGTVGRLLNTTMWGMRVSHNVTNNSNGPNGG